MSIKHSAIIAAFTLATLAAAPAFAASAPAPVAAQPTTAAAPTTALTPSARVDGDAARYAKRETRAKKQQAYRGGDYLVVGISTGAAIVLLVIVLLLI